MSHGVSFMDWLRGQDPGLYETFSKDGIFIERKGEKYVLHITLIDEDISLVELNKLQNEWDNFMLLEESGTETFPLIVSQNKF